MKHLVKIALTHADIFISAIDVDKKTIEYEVRDKEKGRLLEAPLVSHWELIESDIHFDMRHISVLQASAALAFLTDKVEPVYATGAEVILPPTLETTDPTTSETLSQEGTKPSGSTDSTSSDSANPPATNNTPAT